MPVRRERRPALRPYRDFLSADTGSNGSHYNGVVRRRDRADAVASERPDGPDLADSVEKGGGCDARIAAARIPLLLHQRPAPASIERAREQMTRNARRLPCA
jgi:hypothetical protein